MTRLLLVEDEPSLVLTIEDRLRSEGYEVETTGDGDSGFELAASGDFDLVLLDVNLPRRNGFDVCRDLRQRSVDTPILMLTARGEVVDRVVGLKLGADDYLTKPFDMMELLARIEVLLRRGRSSSSSTVGTVVVFGDVRVRFDAAEVDKAGQPVELSALELRLLEYLVEHRGKVLSRDLLLDEVWGYDATPFTRTVDVHIAALRQKLEDTPGKPRFILTVHGHGYKFVG